MAKKKRRSSGTKLANFEKSLRKKFRKGGFPSSAKKKGYTTYAQLARACVVSQSGGKRKKKRR